MEGVSEEEEKEGERRTPCDSRTPKVFVISWTVAVPEIGSPAPNVHAFLTGQTIFSKRSFNIKRRNKKQTIIMITQNNDFISNPSRNKCHSIP